ncbi:MAG: hypothetical protein C5S38_06915 [Candidatus Methanophagaceae archaeon]|nr:MAG: hypothetical protein C5S38_06915 [Methanophagales archaeon]KAF5429638.1 hypothetical protein C5S36_15070 [Methanophagales archaeon]
MNTNKIALLAIAVVAIGIFALPSTVSLFSGQHSWYDLGGSESDVPCMKCHGDIDDEMRDPLNGVHRNLSSPTCDCHRVNTSTTRLGTGVASSSNSTGPIPGTTSHAAETIACMVCHEHGNELSYPFAGGFNQSVVYDGIDPSKTRYWYNSTNSTGEFAAHNDFIREAIESDLMTDSNEACIACHTRIGVNITWRKSTVMHFDADEDHNGTWELTNFTAHGTNETFSAYKNNWTNSY